MPEQLSSCGTECIQGNLKSIPRCSEQTERAFSGWAGNEIVDDLALQTNCTQLSLNIRPKFISG